ncbi:two-pore potassium channel 1-like [Amaranthus tricolor]|uniref:two-pore potassium channel 1-like n=1 Tax=Amaranthus tricolor TaxID=29722 RepID=UPI0025844C57|nr:two-pore potassium channel 1-like [Amaranthus tricolor]
MLFANDIVLVAETKEEANSKLEECREALEGKGLRISRTKTEYLQCNFNGTELRARGDHRGRSYCMYVQVQIFGIGDSEILARKEGFGTEDRSNRNAYAEVDVWSLKASTNKIKSWIIAEMENQNNLKKPLLSTSSSSSTSSHQNNLSKSRKQLLRRSKSAPLIVSLPKDHYLSNNQDPNPNPIPESIFKKLHPSCRKITTFLSLYLLIGAITFYLIKDQIKGKKTTNTIIDALYFCMVTMTTVGYGDLVPQTSLAKFLACTFVFSGMALVGLVLSQGADYLVEKQEKLIVKALKKRKKLYTNNIIMKQIEITSNVRHKCIVIGLLLIVLIICGTIILIKVEELDVMDAIYCVCVTMTSLGYGDYGFSTQKGRAFAVLWILLSTICMAQLFLYLAELSSERKQNAIVKKVLKRQVSVHDLEAADLDDDGVVDAAEYALYKLKEMRKITQKDIYLVMKEFEQLDVHQSGTLSVQVRYPVK